MKTLYNIYFCIVAIPLLSVVTVLAAIVTVLACALGAGRLGGYLPAKIWARIFCWLSFVKVSVKGRQNITPHTSYVFVANHQGAYDIFSIFGFLNHNFRWMMKSALRSIPFVGYACEKSHQIYVDNSSPSATRITMQRAESVLKSGISVVVFPEGSRTFNGHMGQFKRGAFRLASEFRLPVVPLSIDGAYDVMPRTARLPHWGHITITIHRPILCNDGEEYDTPAVMRQSAEAIRSALPERFR